MKILYLGDDYLCSTSFHRVEALRRLGHDVLHVNPMKALPNSKWISGLSVRVGFWIFEPFVFRYLKNSVQVSKYDIIWVNCSACLGPKSYKFLTDLGGRIVHYLNDDPFGGRDGRKWNNFLSSIHLQDLLLVVRDVNLMEAYNAGAKKVQRIYMSYDPVAHAPVNMTSAEVKRLSSEVSFIGTWMPERGPFLLRLLELGVPLTIRGSRWDKAPEWETIRRCWAGPEVQGREYVAAIQASKVALGLLSKGNRDLHTTRSAEIPFIGGAVFCAERTVEHEKMFREGVDAMLWSGPEECAAQCKQLLADGKMRQIIAQSAKKRIKELTLSNDQILAGILSKLE